MFMIQEEIKLLIRLQEVQRVVTIVAFVNICPFVVFFVLDMSILNPLKICFWIMRMFVQEYYKKNAPE